jgi:hypothetical protein
VARWRIFQPVSTVVTWIDKRRGRRRRVRSET